MANRKGNAYSTLGVQQYATGEEIRSAYLALAKIYHPDLKPGEKLHEEQFKRINRAFEILKNPKKRLRYDAKLEPRVLSRLLLVGPQPSSFGFSVMAIASLALGIGLWLHSDIIIKRPVPSPELPLPKPAVSDSPPRRERAITRFSFPEEAPLAAIFEATVSPPPAVIPSALTSDSNTASLQPPGELAPLAPATPKVQRPLSKKPANITRKTTLSKKPNPVNSTPRRVTARAVSEITGTPGVITRSPNQSHVSEVLTGGF